MRNYRRKTIKAEGRHLREFWTRSEKRLGSNHRVNGWFWQPGESRYMISRWYCLKLLCKPTCTVISTLSYQIYLQQRIWRGTSRTCWLWANMQRQSWANSTLPSWTNVCPLSSLPLPPMNSAEQTFSNYKMTRWRNFTPRFNRCWSQDFVRQGGLWLLDAGAKCSQPVRRLQLRHMQQHRRQAMHTIHQLLQQGTDVRALLLRSTSTQQLRHRAMDERQCPPRLTGIQQRLLRVTGAPWGQIQLML